MSVRPLCEEYGLSATAGRGLARRHVRKSADALDRYLTREGDRAS